MSMFRISILIPHPYFLVILFNIIIGYNESLILNSQVSITTTNKSKYNDVGDILLMDHLNINHEKGRHDLVKAFYVDLLGLTLDLRKLENIEKGKKTLWTNAGITQFHLPEAEDAQVFDGVITLAYKEEESLNKVILKLKEQIQLSTLNLLQNTKFDWKCLQNEDSTTYYSVTDPWGSVFKLVVDSEAYDIRGCQPGDPSLPCAISDLCVHVPQGTSLDGIARFYEQVMKSKCLLKENDDKVSVIVSPQQTLTFKHSPSIDTSLKAQEKDFARDLSGKIISNTGPHISMYVRDLPGTYQRVSEVGCVFVNTRFKRQAYTIEEAIDQSMFRSLDIVDPDNISQGVLFRLEHEIRSVVDKDGKKYKSCPFNEILI